MCSCISLMKVLNKNIKFICNTLYECCQIILIIKFYKVIEKKSSLIAISSFGSLERCFRQSQSCGGFVWQVGRVMKHPTKYIVVSKLICVVIALVDIECAGTQVSRQVHGQEGKMGGWVGRQLGGQVGKQVGGGQGAQAGCLNVGRQVRPGQA